MTQKYQNTRILLKSRPVGNVTSANFEVVRDSIEAPTMPNQVLVQNIYLSLDPAMRGWMSDKKSYIRPVGIGEVMRGATISRVIKSNSIAFKENDIVSGLVGWQEYAIVDAKNIKKIKHLPGVPISSYLSVLGYTGLTAYFGLLDIGKPKPGETVLISAATGSTGSIAGQIAKIKGCRVVGITGSDDKCKFVIDQLGFDDCINYKEVSNWSQVLDKKCPKGVDIYFDNVGGDILNAALSKLNTNGRVVLSGAISQYNTTTGVQGPSNYMTLISTRSTMRGFIVFDYVNEYPKAIKQLVKWVQKKKIKSKDHIVDGLENAPESLSILFSGEKVGKLIVKISREPFVLPSPKL